MPLYFGIVIFGARDVIGDSGALQYGMKIREYFDFGRLPTLSR
jgi:hypothetical protein